MFTSPRFPTGLSVEQAKKDAKQFAKNNHSALSKGQNAIAFVHGRSSWSTLIQRIKKPLSLIPGQAPFDNRKHNRALLAIMGNAGSGKTTLMLNSALHLLQSGERVVMISSSEYHAVNSGRIHNESKPSLLKTIITSHPDRFSLIDPENTACVEVMLNGAVLMISEDAMLNNAKNPEFEKLLKASMHTIVCISRLSDLKLSAGNLFDDERVERHLLFTPGADASEGLWWADRNMLKQLSDAMPFRKDVATHTMLVTPTTAMVLEFSLPDGHAPSIPFVPDIIKESGMPDKGVYQ